MPLISRNAAFEKLGVSRCLQQALIVVGFQNQRVAVLQMHLHLCGDMPQIGCYTQCFISICSAQLQRLAGIVWHGKGAQL